MAFKLPVHAPFSLNDFRKNDTRFVGELNEEIANIYRNFGKIAQQTIDEANDTGGEDLSGHLGSNVVHGVGSGSVVMGTNTVQTFSNKTMGGDLIGGGFDIRGITELIGQASLTITGGTGLLALTSAGGQNISITPGSGQLFLGAGFKIIGNDFTGTLASTQSVGTAAIPFANVRANDLYAYDSTLADTVHIYHDGANGFVDTSAGIGYFRAPVSASLMETTLGSFISANAGNCYMTALGTKHCFLRAGGMFYMQDYDAAFATRWSMDSANGNMLMTGTLSGLTSLNIASTTTVSSILDEDDMVSDLATALATQQSIKAYADTKIAKAFLDAKGDLISATANDTPAILGVGTDGYRLEALAAAATGLAWVAPPTRRYAIAFKLVGALVVATEIEGGSPAIAGTLKRVSMSRGDAGSGGTTLIDVNINGSSIFDVAAAPSIDATDGDDFIVSVTSFDSGEDAISVDDRITVDIVTKETGGGPNAPQDLVVVLYIEPS